MPVDMEMATGSMILARGVDSVVCGEMGKERSDLLRKGGSGTEKG